MPRTFPIVSNTRIMPSGVSGIGGVGSGVSGSATPMLPNISGPATRNAGATAGDATPVNPGRATITTVNPSTISFIPTAQSVWEFTPIVDLNGDEITALDGFDLEDILRVFGWADTTVAPTDMVISFGVSAGPVSATNVGVAGLLVATAGRWRLYHSVAAGVSWSAPTTAAADSALTIGGCLQQNMGTNSTQGRPNVFGMDATGNPITTINTMTSPPNANSQASYDRMFIGVGWQTGSGGTGATHDIGLSGLFLRLAEVPDILPFDIGAPTQWPSVVRKIAVIGHSMMNGNVIDPTWNSVAVQSGWIYRSAGTTAANWPAATSPGISILPYLVDNAIDQGSTNGDRYIIRRATVGVALGGNTDVLITGLRDDVIALNLGDPDVIIVWLGANDVQDAVEYANYISNVGLRRVIMLLRAEFPTAVFMLLGEETTDPATYQFIPEINAHKQALAAEIPFVRYVDSTGISMDDTIHPDVPGYVDMANRTTALWLGQ